MSENGLDSTPKIDKQVLSTQLRELISRRSEKETVDEPRITLYRVITGAGKNVNGDWMFEGTDPVRIKEYGIFEASIKA